jgi:polysaccharide biosynthesis transport protein
VVRVSMGSAMAASAQSASARLIGAQAIPEELDVGALGRALWRRKLAIILPTLAAAAIAVAAVYLVTPRYKSEARVLIETRENVFLRPEADKTLEPEAAVDEEAVASQIQLILSRDLARDIIAKLKLGERPEFDPVLRGPSLVRTLLSFVGLGRDPVSMTPEERVLKSFQDRLVAYQAEKSRVIVIEFESEDPELAAQAANAIAQQYLVLQRAARQAQTRSAAQWLAGEIETLRAKVAQAEAKIEQERSKSGLLIGSNNVTISTQQLGELNTQLAAARAQKADAEARARAIQEALRAGGPIEVSDVTNSELIRRLSEQRVTLRAQLAEQSSTLLDGHPRIKELKAQIADLDRQIRAEMERIGRSLENDAKIADARMTNLGATLDQLKQQAALSNEQDVPLRALERDAKAQRDLLESYLAKYREATARDNLGAASPDARIISTATVSNTPAWPKLVPTVLVATLGMLALTVGFVLTGELLATMPIQGGAPGLDIEASLGRAAREPHPKQDASAADQRTLTARPLDATEALANDLAAAGEDGRRITLVGVMRNVGATTAAIALGRTLGRHGSVVLVDLAFGSRNLAAISSDPTAPGIAELIQGSASFGDVITRDRHSRMHLVMAGRAAADAQAIIDAPRLSITLEALAQSYDYLVVDASALPAMAADRFVSVIPRVVLITTDIDDPLTFKARDELLHAGFAEVSTLVHPGEAHRAPAAQAAA